MKQVVLVILLTFSTIFANSQGWMWAKQFTGAGQNQPVGIAYDATGCSYTYGNFTSTVNQDALTLTCSGPQDIYFAKYDKNGQVLWLKQFGGLGSETAISMIFSKDGNYIYLLGYTNSLTCSFDGNGLSNTGLNDIFLTKYDLNGNLQWVKDIAYGADQQYMGNLNIDADNNIILTGHFLTSVTFYGGTTTLTSLNSGIRQSFISKLDQNGNLIWAKMLQGDNSSTTIRSVSVDNSGYYFSGISVGNILFDVGTISAIGWDGFLYKTDLNGNGQWVRKMTGSGNEIIWRHKGDLIGNQYLTGHYNSPSISIDSTGTVVSNGNYTNLGSATNDVFLIKYNSNGVLQWARSIGTTGDDLSYSIDINNDKSIITGSFAGTMSFDSFSLTSYGNSDVFLIECNSFGQFQTAKKIGGKLNDFGKASAYSSTGRNFVTTGEFYSDTLIIGTNQFVNASALRDAYVTKFGCFDSINAQIIPASACYDGLGVPLADGSVSLTPSFGNEPYTYNWSTGTTTNSISGLVPGSYSVTVTGTNGCSLTKVTNVLRKPFLQASITSVINPSCNGNATGSATVTATLGTPPYSYLWSSGEIAVTISNKIAGSYTVTVTDNCGTEVICTASITQPALLTATLTQTNVSCYGGSTGSANVVTVGGTSPYSYLWNDPSPAQTTANCTSLTAGNWIVTITDSKGCSITKSVTITQPLVSLTSSINSQVNVSCYGGSNGSAKVVPVGGTLPYTYLWNDPLPAQTTGIATTLTAGTWTVTVTDNNGCINISSVTITQPAVLTTLISAQTNVLCNGGSTGTATVNANGGTAPYSYIWNDPTPVQTTQICSALSAGNWNVTVTDVKGCTSISTVTITQPEVLQVAVSSTNSKTCTNSGTATALASNGTPTYSYIWKKSGSANTIGTTSTISNLAPATYNVTVTDYCGATKINSIIVASYSSLSSATANTFCSTTSTAPCNGYATALAVGGNLPLTYQWNTIPIQTTVETTHTLCANNTRYRVTITDACGNSKTSGKRKISLCAKSMGSDETFITENGNNILIYPNPAADQLSILIDNDESSNDNGFIDIEIYNLLGELISKEKKEILFGIPILKDVSHFVPGLYLVKVINGAESITERILIQK